MHWSSPFSSIYGNLPDVFSPKSGQHDKENFANRSCTFGENPSTKIEKECSVSKPATPTSLPIVPRRKVSTPLRVRQAPQSDEEDEKFDYLAKRPFPTDARSSIPDVILLPGVEVRDKVLYHSILSASSDSGDLCTPEFSFRVEEAVLDLRDIGKVVSANHGILPSSSLALHDLASQSSPDPPTTLDCDDRPDVFCSPEISPFKTFTTTKAPLGFDITKPHVSVCHVRKDDGYGDVEHMNYSYEEDMILETDCESTSSVADSPISVVSTSPPASSRPRALQKNHVEHEDEDAEDMVLESDSASISLLFEPVTPVSASPPDNPPSRPVIPRLNPDAPHFIPRCAFLLSTADVPAAQVRLPHSVSDSHVDGGITAVQREDETMYPIIRSLWPAETTDVDDIAFLLYFGLIDLGSP